jgi:hypothetical protein
MATPKKPKISYSAVLRQRHQARGRSAVTAGNVVQIGNWLLADEDGALIIINRATGMKTVLINGGGEDHGQMRV